MLFGGFLAFWFLSHPLLHSEFEDAQWRAAVLPRAMTIATWLLAAILVIAAGAGVFRYRQGWSGVPGWKIRQPAKWPRFKVHLLIVSSLLWLGQALLVWWYLVLLARDQ